jgi:hypothetical protein
MYQRLTSVCFSLVPEQHGFKSSACTEDHVDKDYFLQCRSLPVHTRDTVHLVLEVWINSRHDGSISKININAYELTREYVLHNACDTFGNISTCLHCMFVLNLKLETNYRVMCSSKVLW